MLLLTLKALLSVLQLILTNCFICWQQWVFTVGKEGTIRCECGSVWLTSGPQTPRRQTEVLLFGSSGRCLGWFRICRKRPPRLWCGCPGVSSPRRSDSRCSRQAHGQHPRPTCQRQNEVTTHFTVSSMEVWQLWPTAATFKVNCLLLRALISRWLNS